MRDEIDPRATLARMIEVERGRHDLITHREDAEDRFDRACTAEQVPDRRFGRTHRQIPDRIAEQPPHRAKLPLVAERGQGPFRLGLSKSGHTHPRLPHHTCHQPDATPPLRPAEMRGRETWVPSW